MKGLFLILFFYIVSPLVTFGSDFHSENNDFSSNHFTISSTENHTQCNGICEEEEFYKLGNEERKDFTPLISFNDSKSYLRKFTTISIDGTYQEFQNKSYLYKIGVLRL